MSQEQLPPSNTPASSFELPLVWRIVIAAIAAVIVVALAWQFFGNKIVSSIPPTPNTSPVAGTSQIDQADTPEALFKLGNDYYKAGKLDEAVTTFQKAIELNPQYDAAYANLGAVYYAQQKLDLAQQTYLKAIELSPNDADLIYNLGAIYMQDALAGGTPDQTKLQKALDQINRAIELKPDLAQPYYGLGVANQLLGNNAEAIAAFEKFLKLDDNSDATATGNATQILQQLKAGSK